MNISPLNGMTPGSTPQILPPQPSKQNGEEGKSMPSPEKDRAQIIKMRETEADKEKEKNSKVEDLVLKPSPTTLEERLNQVISEEEVKDILSLVTGVPLAKDDEHRVDVKR